MTHNNGAEISPPPADPSAWLRARIADEVPLILPGAYDAVSARLIERSGAEAVYAGGFATIASAFGVPDVGLIAGGELVDVYRRIREATSLPLLVDIDTGYGSVANVRRTVHEISRAGVAGFHIEDQENPKRCGHLEPQRVASMGDATLRVAAAVRAAQECAHPPVVVARTDAMASEGLDAAIERIRRYRAEGADMTFVDAVPSIDVMRRIRDEVEGPLLFNGASTGKSPCLTAAEVKDLGFNAVIYPVELLLSGLGAAVSVLQSLAGAPDKSSWLGFEDLTELLGLPAVEDWVDSTATVAPSLSATRS